MAEQNCSLLTKRCATIVGRSTGVFMCTTVGVTSDRLCDLAPQLLSGLIGQKRSPRAPRHGGTTADRGLAQSFDDGGVGHAASLAHRLEAVPAAALLQSVDECCHDARTAGAQRVADGDGTAVDVGLGKIRASVVCPRQRNGSRRRPSPSIHPGVTSRLRVDLSC